MRSILYPKDEHGKPAPLLFEVAPGGGQQCRLKGFVSLILILSLACAFALLVYFLGQTGQNLFTPASRSSSSTTRTTSLSSGSRSASSTSETSSTGSTGLISSFGGALESLEKKLSYSSSSSSSLYDSDSSSSEYSVAFYKTHKTGSTAVFALMIRYAFEQNYTLFDAQCLGHSKAMFKFPNLQQWAQKAQEARKQSGSITTNNDKKPDYMIEHTTPLGLFPANQLMHWFPLMSEILRREVKFVTIFRQPVDHLLSYYNFYIESDLPLYRQKKSNLNSFDRALMLHLSLMRRIVDFADIRNWEKSYLLQNSVNKLHGVESKLQNMLAKELGVYNYNDLRYNLYDVKVCDKFDLIMILEEWDKSLLLLAKVLKWDIKENVFDNLLQLPFSVKKWFGNGAEQSYLLPTLSVQEVHNYDYIIDSLMKFTEATVLRQEIRKYTEYGAYVMKLVQVIQRRRPNVPHSMRLMDYLQQDLSNLDTILYNYATSKLNSQWYSEYCAELGTDEHNVLTCNKVKYQFAGRRFRLKNYCKRETPSSQYAKEFRKCSWYRVDDDLWKKKDASKWKPDVDVPYVANFSANPFGIL